MRNCSPEEIPFTIFSPHKTPITIYPFLNVIYFLWSSFSEGFTFLSVLRIVGDYGYGYSIRWDIILPLAFSIVSCRSFVFVKRKCEKLYCIAFKVELGVNTSFLDFVRKRPNSARCTQLRRTKCGRWYDNGILSELAQLWLCQQRVEMLFKRETQ